MNNQQSRGTPSSGQWRYAPPVAAFLRKTIDDPDRGYTIADNGQVLFQEWTPATRAFVQFYAPNLPPEKSGWFWLHRKHGGRCPHFLMPTLVSSNGMPINQTGPHNRHDGIPARGSSVARSNQGPTTYGIATSRCAPASRGGGVLRDAPPHHRGAPDAGPSMAHGQRVSRTEPASAVDDDRLHRTFSAPSTGAYSSRYRGEHPEQNSQHHVNPNNMTSASPRTTDSVTAAKGPAAIPAANAASSSYHRGGQGPQATSQSNPALRGSASVGDRTSAGGSLGIQGEILVRGTIQDIGAFSMRGPFSGSLPPMNQHPHPSQHSQRGKPPTRTPPTAQRQQPGAITSTPHHTDQWPDDAKAQRQLNATSPHYPRRQEVSQYNALPPQYPR